jgi:hypothetical protein
MRTTMSFALLSAFIAVSQASAQTPYKACIDRCYQEYLVGMNACRVYGYKEACMSNVEQNYSFCRVECQDPGPFIYSKNE